MWSPAAARYEVERWPLWRLDRNAAYLLKHLIHVPQPATHADAAWWAAQNRYLTALRARLNPAATTTRLVAGGDLMWLRDGWSSFMSPGIQETLSSADASLANLETPVEPRRPVPRYTYETPRYNAPVAYLDPWTALPGRHILSLCNNHALDQGLPGLRATRRAVEARDLIAIGGADDEAQAVRLVQLGALRLAIVGLTFGINGLLRHAAGPPGIPIHAFGDPRAATDWPAVERLLARARSLDPDWLIVMPHWGYEYEYWPDAAMRADAHRLITLGADLILGASPHVLQPVEVASINHHDPQAPTQLQRPGPPRHALIAYSLGDLASILPTAGCQTGALLSIGLGAGHLTSLHATPTVCYRGLGCGPLQARAHTLTEARSLIPAPRWAALHAHATRALGPLLT